MMMELSDFLIVLGGKISCFGLFVPIAIAFTSGCVWMILGIFGIDFPIVKFLKGSLAILLLSASVSIPMFMLSLMFFGFAAVK